MIGLSYVIKVVVLLGALGVGAASYHYYGLKEDNIVEEVCEEIVEQQTGFDFDLTPLSIEEDEYTTIFDFELSPAFIFTNAS